MIKKKSLMWGRGDLKIGLGVFGEVLSWFYITQQHCLTFLFLYLFICKQYLTSKEILAIT